MALITVFTLVSVLTIVLQCRPFKKVWEPSIKGTCINPNILVRLVEVYSGREPGRSKPLILLTPHAQQSDASRISHVFSFQY